jgi:hypothetical protein
MWVVCRISIRVTVLSLIGHDASSVVCQTDLQAALSFINEKLESSSYTSFSYQTIQVRNIPLEPTRIEIWANKSPNQNKWLIILLSLRNYLTRSSLLYLSETTEASCTPARQNAVRVHLHICSRKAHTVKGNTQQNISFKKIFKVQKWWANESSAVAQVYHTALNTSGLLVVLRGWFFFILSSLWRCCYDC